MALTPNQYLEIKDRVRAEMARRNGYGPLDSYSTRAYDFTTIPEAGVQILPEH